jgi:hypothetical protein
MGYYDDDYALEQLRMEFRSKTIWQQEQITKSQYSFKKWVESTLSAIWNFITDIATAVGRLAKRLWNVLFG